MHHIEEDFLNISKHLLDLNSHKSFPFCASGHAYHKLAQLQLSILDLGRFKVLFQIDGNILGQVNQVEVSRIFELLADASSLADVGSQVQELQDIKQDVLAQGF